MESIKFFYNGIKVDGKLFKAYFSPATQNSVVTHINVYAKEYIHFPKAVWDTFKVNNDSDSQSDYFETDSIQILPDHKFFKDAVKMCILIEEKRLVKINSKLATALYTPIINALNCAIFSINNRIIELKKFL